MDELFDTLTRIIAHPHTAITDHDRIRAAKVMLEIADFHDEHPTDDASDLYPYAKQLLDGLEGRKPLP